MQITINYDLVWQLKSAPNYQFTDNGICINTLRCKQVRKVVVSGTKGYCINGKFKSVLQLRKDLIKIRNKMKKLLLIMVLCLTTFILKASDCPTSVTYDVSTKQFTFHFSTMPSGYSSFTHLRIKVKSGKGAGNTYNINIISMTSNTIVIGDGSGVIDGTTITNTVDYHDKDHNGPTCTTDISLPVKFISFKYIKNSFKWYTATENNNKIFILQSSDDAKIWLDIDSINSKSICGNSSTVLEYAIKTVPASNYWRIKQIDYNGIFEYSNIIHVNIIISDPITINSMGIIVSNPTDGIYYIYSNNTWTKVFK